MKKKWIAVFAAMVMATAVFAASPKFPSYLIMSGTTVKGYADGLPADLVIPDGVKKIDDEAFRGCRSLKSVMIPGSVKKINDEAFADCTSLISVTIASGVKEIGWFAFRGCTSLASVTIGKGIAEIGNQVFGDCTSLASIAIPSSVKEIDDNAFKGCRSLREIQFGGTMTQWKEMRGTHRLYAPSLRCSNGFMGVKEAPEYLKISGTEVTGYIGKVPAEVIIPEGVTEIDYDAFENCSDIESVSIPSSVKKIGRDAFHGCLSLKSVTIPSSVTAIGNGAFSDCTSLKEIRFAGTTAQWKAIYGTDDIPVSFIRCSNGNIGIADVPLYLKMHGTKVTGCNGEVPASIVIPKDVTEIGYGAFSGCTSLKEIQFQGTKAQWEAIQGSKDVKAPYISFTDGYIGVKEVPAYLKMEGTEVTGYNGKVPANLVIPDGVTEINDRAFKGCLDIESLTIPGSVKKIDDGYGVTPNGYGTFSDCTYLERVTILDGLLKIPVAIFYNCTSLANVTIPSSVTSIGGYAFWNCAALKNVTIPGNVKEIGSSAFEDCTSLVSVNIIKGVTEIGSFAFRNCKSLASVTIPEGVTKIGGGAFYGCTSLKSVVIPASVTYIGTAEIRTYNGELLLGAFEGCTSLASVTIPSSVTEIDAHTFKGCTSLRSVTIPRGVTSIGDKAFSDCKSLMSVSIPRSVTEIGQNAFSECTPNLKVQYDGTKAQWSAISKGKNYYFPTLGSFVVQCTDGVLTEK